MNNDDHGPDTGFEDSGARHGVSVCVEGPIGPSSFARCEGMHCDPHHEAEGGDHDSGAAGFFPGGGPVSLDQLRTLEQWVIRSDLGFI